MKKQDLTLIGLLALSGLQFSAQAMSYTDSNGLKYELTSSTKTAVFQGIDEESVGSIKTLVIPATLNIGNSVYNVVEVAENSCYGNRNITTLEIGENVKSIGKNAFSSCSQLVSILFPDNLESIGVMSFYNCTKLEAVNLPSNLKSIDDFAFFYVPMVTTVNIPASVTTLGKAPFGDCPALQTITVDEENPNFTAVDGVLYSKDMTLLIVYPIGNGATSFTMPETVTVLGGNSMRNNKVMTSVTLSPNLVTIEDGAFNYCTITSYHIPASVEYIGNQVFSANDKLTSFTVDSDNANYTANEGMLLTKDMKKLLYGIAVQDIVIPEGVEEICNGAFYRYPAIKTLTLSTTVKTIEQSAFSSCTGLNTINFSTGLETIGLQGFYRCTGLKSLTIPSTVRNIGSAAFAACGLKTLVIEDGLESVDESAFQSCMSLQSVTLPSTMKSISTAMFYACLLLSDINLPEGLGSIGSSAFSSCGSLKSITFPESLKEIGNFAFNSTVLETLTLPEGLITIGEGAFENCTFPSVELPNSVQTVGPSAFSWNSGMTSFKSGTGLVELSSNALAKCDHLTDLQLNDGLQTVGAGAFHACEAIETIELPSSVTFVGNMAFAMTNNLSTLKVHAQVPPTTDGSFYNEAYSGYDVVTLYVPESAMDKYLTAPEWANYINMQGIPDSGVANINSPEAEVVEILDINGMHRPAAGKGICIYRMSDGTVKKVMK